MRYATNDDTTMLAIAAGGYGGRPSPYVVNIHFLIGYILKTLYTVIPDVNWFTVLYFALYSLAFIYTVFILLKPCRGLRRVWIPCLLFTGFSFFLLINFFSFTVIAYALLTAGLVGLTYMAETAIPVRGRSLMAPAALIVLAAMMRTDVINTAIIIAAVYGIITSAFCKEKKRLIETAVVIAGLVLTEVIVAYSNTWFLYRDSTEAAFYKWGEWRSRALDCAQVPYDETLFSQHSFSKASYDACYGAFYYIREAVSTEKMEMLVDWNTQRYNPHIIGFIKAHFAAYLTTGYRRIWQGMFAIISIAGIILGDKERRIKHLTLYIAVISADYVYHFIQRPMFHVMMPTYVMGAMIGVVIFATGVSSQSMDQKRKKTWMRLLAVLTAGLIGLTLTDIYQSPIKYSMILSAEQADDLHEAREYMRKHPDKLFFALDPTVFAVSTDEDMWHNRYASEVYNLAGNWEIYSLPSNTMFKSYGIDSKDPGRELPGNDKAIFLQSSEDSGDPNQGYVIDLYREYYDMNVHFQQICVLGNGWKTYRLINDEE